MLKRFKKYKINLRWFNRWSQLLVNINYFYF